MAGLLCLCLLFLHSSAPGCKHKACIMAMYMLLQVNHLMIHGTTELMVKHVRSIIELRTCGQLARGCLYETVHIMPQFKLES